MNRIRIFREERFSHPKRFAALLWLAACLVSGGVSGWSVPVAAQDGPASSPCANGIAVPDPQDQPGLVADCEVLLSIRDGLAGDAHLNWSRDIPIAEWDGIEVIDFRVRVMSFYSKGLTGSIPPQLGRLTQLRRLELTHNELTGAIPPELGQLDSLRRLGLSYNELTGAIPPELGQLDSLRELGLYDNRLTGPIPPELGQLTGIWVLELGFNRLTGPIPPELGKLTQLLWLELTRNELTGAIPPELGQLTGLSDLLLGSNNLTGPIPPELGQLDSLWYLWLSVNQLTGPIPPELGKLTQLLELQVSGNQLTGAIPPELGQLDSLRELGLYDNQLTGPIPPELGQLDSLRYLSLSANQLTGPIPPELGKLTNLEQLFLVREQDHSGNQISCIPAALAKWVDLPVCSTTTIVEVSVLGSDVEGLTVEFSRSTSGRRRSFAWSNTTDADGRLALTVSSGDRAGVSGFYEARVRTEGGQVVGRWHSIPLNRDRRQVLELTLGGGMRMVSAERLEAAKEAAASKVPAASGLGPNHPNPFNDTTGIPYRLAAPGPVRLAIYNNLGQPVRTLVNEFQAAGSYQVSWDARDEQGAAVATGVYLSRLSYSGGEQTRRLLLLR